MTQSPNVGSIYRFGYGCEYDFSEVSNKVNEELKASRKRNVNGISYIKDFAGCDNYYYISDKLMNQAIRPQEEDSKDYSDATAAQLSKALINKAGGKTAQRFLASMLAEQIAEVYS